MKHFGCLVVYSALTLLVLAKADEAKIVGYFSMETGSSCRYAVMDFKDDNKTGLHVKCSCPGGGGSGTKKIQYSCVYFGVPSSCDAYLDKSDGPETFFAEFADFIKSKLFLADRIMILHAVGVAMITSCIMEQSSIKFVHCFKWCIVQM